MPSSSEASNSHMEKKKMFTLLESMCKPTERSNASVIPTHTIWQGKFTSNLLKAEDNYRGGTWV